MAGTQVLELDTASAVLDAARTARAAADREEARLLGLAVGWAAMHSVDSLDDAATICDRYGDTGIPVAGPGAPLVAEFCVAELAAALGLPTDVGRTYLGHAVELRYRLPRVWRRVQAGDLAAWRARRIADQTLTLSREAAAFVDAHVAHVAHRIRPAAVHRLVEEAIARFDPEVAAAAAEAAQDRRSFTIDTHGESFAGTAEVWGTLDLADALDLEAAVTDIAGQLKDLGDTESLDARRAAALGELARGQATLDLPTRPLVVHVHGQVAEVEGPDVIVTTEQVAAWCSTAAKVTIKPVIDLHQRLCSDGYAIPDRIADHVRLRDPHCVFPWCSRPSRSCDLDHVVPFDPLGPPGQTSTDNHAPLCRRHHRHKTFGGWTYAMTRPGSYEWTSPHGHRYRVDHHGTERQHRR